jgi:hypothetical protein
MSGMAPFLASASSPAYRGGASGINSAPQKPDTTDCGHRVRGRSDAMDRRLHYFASMPLKHSRPGLHRQTAPFFLYSARTTVLFQIIQHQDPIVEPSLGY